MQNLTAASRELFRRSPDECFESLDLLYQRCQADKERSEDFWHWAGELRPVAIEGRLELEVGDKGAHRLNDWSFSQLCKIAGVSKDTLNKLRSETAGQVLVETLPGGSKPTQVLSFDRTLRSIHGASYTRLHNLDLLNVVQEFATDFHRVLRAVRRRADGPEDGRTEHPASDVRWPIARQLIRPRVARVVGMTIHAAAETGERNTSQVASTIIGSNCRLRSRRSSPSDSSMLRAGR